MKNGLNNLFEILEEQASISFTGKIKFIQNDIEEIAQAYFKDGQVIHLAYNDLFGERAFLNIAMLYADNEDIRTIFEPTRLVQVSKNLHHPYSVHKRRICSLVELSLNNKQFRPPLNKKIMINPIFIHQGDDLEAIEYHVLQVISDYNLVEDIYHHANLADFEITNCLISLRKKKALKVLS
jgi:hypothetical protein